MNTADSVPDDIVALHAELAAERAARREAEARAIGAEAMVTHLKLVIAKLVRGDKQDGLRVDQDG